MNAAHRPSPAASPGGRFGVRTAFAVVGLALVAVPFMLLLLLVRDGWGPLRRLDLATSTGLHRFALAHAGAVTAMKAISAIGTTAAWTVITLVAVVYLWSRGLRRLAAFAVVTVAGSVAVNNLVKAAVSRARPVLPHPVAHTGGFSFPSGHAQAAMTGYAVLLLVFLPVLHGMWRGIAVAAAALMIAAIGFARIGLGVHYLSDVIAGYVLGAAWVAVMVALFNAWRAERGRPKAHVSEGLEPEDEPRTARGD